MRVIVGSVFYVSALVILELALCRMVILCKVNKLFGISFNKVVLRVMACRRR
jgi:hypothetical protein